MIPRYSQGQISKIWTDKNRYEIWFQIEVLVCEKLYIDKKISKKDFLQIKKKGKVDVEDIQKLDRKTHHEVIAFLNSISKKIGKSARHIHQGITSSDIIDTAFSIQLKQSSEILIKDITQLLKALKTKAYKYKKTICLGRTHGIHAEPTTFGLKIAGFYAEMERNLERLKKTKDDISICAISGAVGTYATIDPSIEIFVAKKMVLKPETVSTQIIPRDRHANLFSIFGIIASSIERIATEIRHLQRTEVREVEEFFSKNQKGSSAMPHKRNPILSENLTGLSRFIRSAVVPMMENIVLWHERDISHSSVERILAPDVTISLNFALNRLTNLISNLKIYPENMKKNLDLLKGLIFSQALLLVMIDKKGMERQKAYNIVQKNAMNVWKSKKSFLETIKEDKDIRGILSDSELSKLFNVNNYLKKIDYIFSKIFGK
ncbi:MAG: Adenylosuccinate lyase [Alphaproteobacteria bacterium MarineAlpha6_Bin1]|nr:MAG: Adenylosuccinate lyase [Alphaproteobacteria bacterium MarineAlpha6_Bin1]